MIITGWNEFVSAFGKECVVNTPTGTELSINKILKTDAVERIMRLGFEINHTYKSTKEQAFTPIVLTGYDTEMNPVYDITAFFKHHHVHFTKVTKKILVTVKS